MNWRYIYIGSVVVLSYVLFLSWNAEKEIKQEFAEASSIEQNKSEGLLPPGETVGFVQIQNEKLEVLVSPSSGKIWQARLKEHTYLISSGRSKHLGFGFPDVGLIDALTTNLIFEQKHIQYSMEGSEYHS